MCWRFCWFHLKSLVSCCRWWSGYWRIIDVTPTVFGAHRESRYSCLPFQSLWTCQSHVCAPTETRLDWSPLARETSYSWAEVKDCWGKSGTMNVWALSLQTSFQGSTRIRMNDLLHCWVSCSQPKQPALLHGAWGRFELLGQGQHPPLVSPHDCCGCGLAELTFLQVPSAGALLAAMHTVDLHTPVLPGWPGGGDIVPAQSHGMGTPKLKWPLTAVSSAACIAKSWMVPCWDIQRYLDQKALCLSPRWACLWDSFPKASVPRLAMVQWIWGLTEQWCSPDSGTVQNPPREEASAECSSSQLKVRG